MVTYSTENPALESTHSAKWWIAVGFLVLWGLHAFAVPAHAATPPLAASSPSSTT